MDQLQRKGKGVSAGRDQQQQPPKRCPRCESTNTKFCYFNNYSSSQPRHFCKACRRYWTEGGTLRNVPQGGGGNRRGKKSKKPSSSSSSSTSTSIPAAVVGTGAHPDATLMPPAIFYGGALELQQPFHPAGGIIGDIGGFQDPNLMLPGFNFGFPFGQQPFLAQVDPNLMFQPLPPRANSGLSQQLNSAVFTTTTTGPATTSAAAADDDGGEGNGFWNYGFGNGREGGSGGRWAHDPSSRSPPPPPPASFI